MGKERQQRPELDGIRGVACLIVLILHCVGFSGILPSVFGDGGMVGIPKVGVWLFFVLSAFLLTMKHLDGPFSIATLVDYSASRFLRIAPMFVVAVCFYRSVGTLEISSAEDVWSALIFQSSPGHLWTIPAELSFYCLLFPTLFAMNWVGSNFGRHWGLLLLVVICGTMAFVWPPLSTPTSSPNGQWYFLTFACGIAAAVAIKWTGALSTVKKNTLAWVSVFSIIAFIVVGKMGAFGDPKNFLLNKHLVFAAMWALFVFSVYANGGLWGRMVSARWIVAVGKWSFSIYLFHWAIGIYACSYLPPLVGFTIGVLASIGVGYCGYQWLETPIMRLRKPLIAAILGRRATATTV